MTNLFIRPVKESDAEQILEIYRPYVLDTTVTFEVDLPDVDEIRRRIRETRQSFPYLVAEENSKVIGYAYAGKFRSRQAYAQSAEISLYLNQKIRGKGLGNALLSTLELALIEQDIYTLVSIIESSNVGSLKFHEKNGFIRSGYLPRIGYKFDKWLDIHLLTKQIQF